MAKLIDITGKALSGEWGTDDETGCGIPVLRTTNFTNDGIVNYNDVVTRTITKKNLAEKYLRKGDIIIEKSGGSDKQPVGRVIFFEGEENTFLFNNFTGLLRTQDQEKWLPKYVFYALFANYRRGGTKQYENKTTGLHNLKTDDFLNRFEISETSLENQGQICQQIDKIRAITSLRQQELQKMDELVKARFVEMFGNSCDEWPLIRIEDVCTDTRTGPFGSALHHDEFVDKGIFVLGIDNAVENRFSYNRMRYITEEKYLQLKRYTVYPGDVIITIMGTVGRSAVIPNDMPKAINSKHLACLTPDYNKIDSCFLCNAFQIHPEIKLQLSGQTKGAIMDGLNLTIIKGLKFRLPPLEQQKAFVKFYKQVERSKAVVQAALDEVQLLFDSLMQQYFG